MQLPLVLFILISSGLSVWASSSQIPASSHFRKVSLATNLLEPIQLSLSASGDVYFAERHGAIKCWKSQSGETITVGRLDVFTGPEDGLLGLALDPRFETNHWIYAFHSTVGVLENRISRFTVLNDKLDLESQKILLRIPTLPKKPNHSGGGLAFDSHGNLYASTGDYTFISDSDGYAPLDERSGREEHDSQRTAANTNDPRGKILRIHAEADGSYSIPPGNLFPPGTPKTLPEIYIMGCRNPFRFTVDSETDWLIWGDVGPDALQADERRGPPGFDEFNLAKRAGNFGWPYFLANNRPYVKYNFATKESKEAFDPERPINASPNNTGLRELPPAQPAFMWYPPGPSTRFAHLGSGARSAMAGPVYHFDPASNSKRKFPAEFDRLLFIFEWERGWINLIRLTETGELQEIVPFLPDMKFRRPISMNFGPDGALYLIEWGTAWYNNKDAQLVRLEYIF